MDIQVFNGDINLVGIIDSCNSIKWTSKYHSAGNFEIKVPLSKSNIDLFKIGNIVFLDGNAGYIETIQLDMTDDGEIITIIGKDLTAYLARRINWNIVNYSGTVEGFMRSVVNENCINCVT